MKQCVMKYIIDVSNTAGTDYKNALAKDPELAKGSESYRCIPQDQVDAMMALNNVKDDATTITASYKKFDIPQEHVQKTGSGIQAPT